MGYCTKLVRTIKGVAEADFTLLRELTLQEYICFYVKTYSCNKNVVFTFA
jgi:hypothetical protein